MVAIALFANDVINTSNSDKQGPCKYRKDG